MSDAAVTGTWLITGARPLGGDPADVLISGGVIAEIGRGPGGAAARRLDAGHAA